MTDTPPFDLSGPLPTGITVLEASAGTGKTYSIAHLVVRLVAEEGLPVDQLLVVTYTRLATAELRERLRDRVAQAAQALRGQPVEDRLLRAWADAAPPAQRDPWARRLDVAREDFDSAAISTIHGFCQRMLQLNAFESGVSFDLELIPDLSEGVEEITWDWLTRERYGTGRPADDAWREDARRACGLAPADAHALARDGVRDSEVELPPAAGPSLDEWRAAVRALRDLSQTPEGEAQRAVEAARLDKRLDGRSYQKRRGDDAWADLQSWLAADPPPQALDRHGGWQSYFGRWRLAAKAKGDVSDLLAHPLVVGWSALIELAEAVVVAERARFLRHVRQALSRRLAQRFEQGFDNLLSDLAQALRAPERGEALRAAIRERFRAGLIDEFQDTDALQWEIFQTVFEQRPSDPEEGHRLLLIGDPKQAIYAFRGANVHVYLRAREVAQAAFTMTTNFRSDQRLVGGLNHLMDHEGLFGGAAGDGIEYERVDTPPREPGIRLDDARPPIEIRYFDAASRVDGVDEPPGKGDARALLPSDLVRAVVGTLEQAPRVWDEGLRGGAWRAVHPGDLAVLVLQHAQASDAQDALRAAGVPAIIAKNRSVFAAPAAMELQRWLEALTRAGQEAPARVLAATELVGWTAADLAASDPHAWARFVSAIDAWRETYARHGFMRAFRRCLDDLDARARLLRTPSGERRVTDLLHLAELAHKAEKETGLGMSGLLGWLQERRQDPDAGGEAAEARLETDARAVRILTVHASKGLEFPIVFAPYLWDGALVRKSERGRLVVPVEDDPVRRTLDLRLSVSSDDPALARLQDERRAEKVRLMYVALTRARLRLVVWWGQLGGRGADHHDSPLAVLLHGHGAAGTRFARARARVRAASSAELWDDLEVLRAGSDGAVAVTRVSPGPLARWSPPEAAPPALAPRRFTRPPLDRLWALHSYSSLTRGAQAPHPEAPPDQPGLDPDALGTAAPGAAEAPPPAPEVPLAGFPAGAEAGTCLHAFFEVFDFREAHPDAGAEAADAAIRACLVTQLPRHGFDPAQHATPEVVRGLRLALQTPLGGPAGGLRLCDLAPRDRLDELRFDLPLAGGRAWSPGAPTVEAEALVEALAAAPCPGLRPAYLDHLRSLPFGRQRLVGFMTGFIDLVFRHPSSGQFFVVDYKSNRLDPGRVRRYPAQNFTPAHMQAEMEHHHYHLQYLLYSLAVRRFLQHRLGADFRPGQTLGGSYYLFFRGMTGDPLDADGGAPRGVFHDRPPPAVLDALDALFAHPGGAA